MNIRMLAVIAFTALVGATALAAETDPTFKDEKEVCEKVTDVIRIIADGHIEGDFNVRLQVALAVFDRIPCNPRRLLSVLQIHSDGSVH